MLVQTKEYTLLLLKSVTEVQKENTQQIIWEHGRRNFQLRADGVMNIVAPVTQEHGLAGICIFNADAAQVKEIMDEDPAVKEGIFTYEILPIMSFPGDCLAS